MSHEHWSLQVGGPGSQGCGHSSLATSSGLCMTNSSAQWPVADCRPPFFSLWRLLELAPYFPFFCFQCSQLTFVSCLNSSHTYALVSEMVRGDTCFL